MQVLNTFPSVISEVIRPLYRPFNTPCGFLKLDLIACQSWHIRSMLLRFMLKWIYNSIANRHKKCHFNFIALYTTIPLDIKQISLQSICLSGLSFRGDGLYVCVYFMYISFHCCCRTAKGQVSASEMNFLSAWIVSSLALPFLCLIRGKRIKCAVTVEILLQLRWPFQVQSTVYLTIQLSWEP